MKVIGEMGGNKMLVEATRGELVNLLGYASVWDLKRKKGDRGTVTPGDTIEISDNWKLLEMLIRFKERGFFSDVRAAAEAAIDRLDCIDAMEVFGTDEEEKNHD